MEKAVASATKVAATNTDHPGNLNFTIDGLMFSEKCVENALTHDDMLCVYFIMFTI